MADEVRWATVGDADAVASLHIRSWRTAVRDLGSAEALHAMPAAGLAQQWRGRLEDPAGCFAAITGSGWPLGFCAATPGPAGGSSELIGLYVAPERWGAGVGSALLQAVLGRLEADGATSATLWALEPDRRAAGFLARHGFVPDDARRIDVGTRLPEIRLRRSLLTT